MPGLGVIINTFGILAGGAAGTLFGSKIKERFRETLISAMGLCTLFIGIGGCLEEMLTITEDGLVCTGTIIMIICFALGALIGELLNIEKHIESFGNWLRRKAKSEGDSQFVEGFITTSLTVCVGAMTIVGAIKDGMYGDFSVLAAKAVLDAVFVMIMTASLGKGCIFAAIPAAVIEGFFTVIASLIEPFITEEALSNISLTGSILIFCVGVNLVWGKKIRAANLLPSIFLAFLWALLF